MQNFIFENPFFLTSLVLLIFLVRDRIYNKRINHLRKTLELHEDLEKDKFQEAENSLRLINATLIEMNAPFPNPDTIKTEENPYFLGIDPDSDQYEKQMRELTDNIKLVSGLLKEYLRQNATSKNRRK